MSSTVSDGLQIPSAVPAAVEYDCPGAAENVGDALRLTN